MIVDDEVFNFLGEYVKMAGSNQKCKEAVFSEHKVDSRLKCEGEARENSARYFSYVDAHKMCFYTSTCSPIISGTGWAWNIYERKTGKRLYLYFICIHNHINHQIFIYFIRILYFKKIQQPNKAQSVQLIFLILILDFLRII